MTRWEKDKAESIEVRHFLGKRASIVPAHQISLRLDEQVMLPRFGNHMIVSCQMSVSHWEERECYWISRQATLS